MSEMNNSRKKCMQTQNATKRNKQKQKGSSRNQTMASFNPNMMDMEAQNLLDELVELRASGEFQFELNDWWSNFPRYIKLRSKKDPASRHTYSPPNFVSPFNDPALIEKLRNDRRTCDWLNDPKYMTLIKELQQDPAVFDEKFVDREVQNQLFTTLRVVLFGKEGFASSRKPSVPIPPGSGIFPPDLISLWIEILFHAERNRFQNADEVKEAGNAAYKKQEFDEALKHYVMAKEIFPFDMTFLLNIGAVYLQTKKYTACIGACLEAVEVGRENNAANDLMSKAFMRVGRSFKQLGDYQCAKLYYEKALAEASSPEVVSLLAEVEKILDGGTLETPVSPVKSRPTKGASELGCESFQKGNYAKAAEQFTEAIGKAEDPILYRNRAACYLKLLNLDLALKDCSKCLELSPCNAQAVLLKARILQKQASTAFEKALELDKSVLGPFIGYDKVSIQSSLSV
ncbi:unnamed protein product [Orchesella dallaii]|uniref:STI1/HOP DP domain-containing protein n=1 Tax=Orchesella dallaii TaxID=48710 RepID=A0ABP1S6U5_9HEXA